LRLSRRLFAEKKNRDLEGSMSIVVPPAISNKGRSLDYLDVITLCTLAYKDTGATAGSKWKGSHPSNVWNVIAVEEYPNGFRAIYASGCSNVLAFSGTDDFEDWRSNLKQHFGGPKSSPQYKTALDVAKRYKEQLHFVVGHSLGGGLATWVALNYCIPAATINPAPLGKVKLDVKQQVSIVHYVVPGEILDVVDTIDLGLTKKIGKIVHVPVKLEAIVDAAKTILSGSRSEVVGVGVGVAAVSVRFHMLSSLAGYKDPIRIA